MACHYRIDDIFISILKALQRSFKLFKLIQKGFLGILTHLEQDP